MGHVILTTGGMVLEVKMESLKHRVPWDLSDVLEMYKENPRNVCVYGLEGPMVSRMDRHVLIYLTCINYFVNVMF